MSTPQDIIEEEIKTRQEYIENNKYAVDSFHAEEIERKTNEISILKSILLKIEGLDLD